MISLAEALRIATERGLDLVEVSPTADPPVCRIMDYGKFKYQQEKKTQSSKKHQTVIHIKEVKFRPNIQEHDSEFKMKAIRKFLSKGDRVKVTIRFRGREIAHSELGQQLLLRIADTLKEEVVLESQPRMEGRTMYIMVAPKK